MRQGDRGERLHLALVCLLQAAMAAELVLHLSAGRPVFALIVFATMGLVVLPHLARERLGVPLPPSFQIATVLFFFAACVPGEVWNLYGRVPWWDLLMHFSSGVLLAAFGFTLLGPRGRGLPPGLVAAFAFAFALGCAALWEIFEFGMDRAFGTTMQRPMLGDPSGLTDTMLDLILDGAGALLACAYGWHRLRQGGLPFVDAARRPRALTRPAVPGVRGVTPAE